MQIFSFSPFGYEGSLVTVEVDLRRGIPAIDLIGLADGAVKESRERMKSAIRNCGFEFPMERVLISLSPADLKKEGAGFDLAIALAVLDSSSRKNPDGTNSIDENLEPILVMGELELSGALRPVKAVHAAVATAIAAGIRKCIVSSANAAEAREISGMKVFGATNLQDAFEALSNPDFFVDGVEENDAYVPEGSVKVNDVLFPPIDSSMEFSDIKKQKKLVRALQIAAAGGHNLMAFGSPGCGKTLALQRFPNLLPLLTMEEAQSVSRIHSIAGLLSPILPLMRKAPFRMPHQTASIEGICGGGAACRPGEISLSHNGVLFLDEAAEFRASVLQMLRVPLESGSITLSRAGRSTTYPARFQLLMATNPCPCGNYGSSTKICLCSAKSVEQYWRKFSAPLLDRIDIRVEVSSNPESENNVNDEQNFFDSTSISTEELRLAIATATKIQRERQGKRNAYLSPQEILEFCKIEKSDKEILENAASQNDFSQRAVSSILKVARTIADMENSEKIKTKHLEEAISYRNNVGVLGMFSGS